MIVGRQRLYFVHARRYRAYDAGTGPAGMLLGAAELASTVLGAVLLYRHRSVPVVPIATVADHHVLVSLSGAF